MTDDITMFPLTGYAVGTLPGQSVLLQIEYITSPMQRAHEAQATRFAMTAAQATELAQALLRTASTAEGRSDAPEGERH